MSTSGTTTRRSTRTRGGAASATAAASTTAAAAAAAASASSPLQPAATNTPSKKKQAAKTNLQSKKAKATKAAKKSSSNTAATVATAGYSLRKRSASAGNVNNANENTANATVNLGALSDQAFENLLLQHEADGVESKRRRTQYRYTPNAGGTIGNGQIVAALDQLPSPCISLVFEMLPRCRDIYNLAFLSRHLLSHVERRSDIVIRTAVHENARLHGWEAIVAEPSGVVGRRWGGVSRKKDGSNRIVTQIAEAVRTRSIHVPSASRLLRLLCAQRCEKGEGCWGYHLEKDEASNSLGLGQNDPRPFGFAICSKCTENCGRSIPRLWQHWCKEEEKVLILGGKQLFHPTAAADLMTAADGEKVGPILSALHIMQISSSYKADGVEAQREAFQKMVDEMYGKEGDEKYDAYEESASKFVRCYDEADSALDVFLQAKEDATAVNRKALYANKKRTLEQVIEILEEAVEGMPENIRALALDYVWRDDDTTTPLRFGTPFVSEGMERFVRAPSYCTQKAVDNAVAGIRAKLDILNANPDFVSLAFLAPAAGAQGGPQSQTLSARLKQKILNHLQQSPPEGESILQWLAGRSLHHWRWSRPNNYFTDSFLSNVVRKQYRSGLLEILERRINLTEIVKVTLVEDTETNLSNLRLLAGVVWNKLETERRSRQGNYSRFASYSSFLDQVRTARSEYRRMKRNAQHYLADAAVVEWVAAQPQGNGWGLTRAAAVASVWDIKNTVLRAPYHTTLPENLRGNLKPYQLLLDRNFARLLDVHKYYVQRRSMNGLHGLHLHVW